jgi:hypothetical protein
MARVSFEGGKITKVSNKYSPPPKEKKKDKKK